MYTQLCTTKAPVYTSYPRIGMHSTFNDKIRLAFFFNSFLQESFLLCVCSYSRRRSSSYRFPTSKNLLTFFPFLFWTYWKPLLLFQETEWWRAQRSELLWASFPWKHVKPGVTHCGRTNRQGCVLSFFFFPNHIGLIFNSLFNKPSLPFVSGLWWLRNHAGVDLWS